ncbi:hypothetical protein SEEM8284_00703, partial [Salmonella enterica subsp. enterica serovar Montevideo str. IA_2010008284]
RRRIADLVTHQTIEEILQRIACPYGFQRTRGSTS